MDRVCVYCGKSLSPAPPAQFVISGFHFCDEICFYALSAECGAEDFHPLQQQSDDDDPVTAVKE